MELLCRIAFIDRCRVQQLKAYDETKLKVTSKEDLELDDEDEKKEKKTVKEGKNDIPLENLRKKGMEVLCMVALPCAGLLWMADHMELVSKCGEELTTKEGLERHFEDEKKKEKKTTRPERCRDRASHSPALAWSR